MKDKILLDASCVAATIYDGNGNHCVLINYTGGVINGWCVWEPEINNSIYIEDIFCGYEMPPNKPGFYVWEGKIEPVYDDQPNFYGKWRLANTEDMIKLINENKHG